VVGREVEKGTMTTQTTITEPVRSRRRRRSRVAALTAVVALGVALLVGACNPEAYRTSDYINLSRAENGLPPLEFNMMLAMKAQAWTGVMANRGSLSHSDLAADNWGRWQKLGENVGYGWSVESVHHAFMDSAPHRANILDPAFNKVGTGVYRDPSGKYWVVHEFMLE
jgi:uncharacterized protein YkwD